MNFLNTKFLDRDIQIHNTCCGGHDSDHINFLKDLEMNERWSVLNSDLNNYAYEGYVQNNLKSPFEFYDITTPLDKVFDVVINISTLEEIPNIDYTDYFENSYNQLNDNGFLLITCDVPPANLYNMLEDLSIFNEYEFNFQPLLLKPNDALNFNNTQVKNAPNPFCNSILEEHSNIFYLILQKEDDDYE